MDNPQGDNQGENLEDKDIYNKRKNNNNQDEKSFHSRNSNQPLEGQGTNRLLVGSNIYMGTSERNNVRNDAENEEEKKQEEEISVNDVNYNQFPKGPEHRELTKKEQYIKYVREAEDTCDKCPLRCLAFIPIYFGYCCLSFYDFLTYLLVPLGYCLFYTLSFICNYCKNILSQYQVEEEIGFSGAFTSENDIQLHIVDGGGAMHLNEILCFSYMSACVKRYFCFIFVLINHIIVPILQAWKRAKDCFIVSKVEEFYDERMAKIEEAKKYQGFDQVQNQIEIIN